VTRRDTEVTQLTQVTQVGIVEWGHRARAAEAAHRALADAVGAAVRR
jgi:hypothetical protein